VIFRAKSHAWILVESNEGFARRTAEHGCIEGIFDTIADLPWDKAGIGREAMDRSSDRFRCTLYLSKVIDRKGAPFSMPETKAAKRKFGDYLALAEVFIYSTLGVLLAATAAVTIARAAKMLWASIGYGTLAGPTSEALNEILVVLMIVEILHTVRISIHGHILAVAEPFLVVGLIASVRRILLITLEAATLTREGGWTEEIRAMFHASMMELGLLGVLVLILVGCLVLLRRYAPLTKGAAAEAERH
jgi:hypothetical protein